MHAHVQEIHLGMGEKLRYIVSGVKREPLNCSRDGRHAWIDTHTMTHVTTIVIPDEKGQCDYVTPTVTNDIKAVSAVET